MPRAAGLIQPPVVHVVAGILRDAQGRVLLAQRPAGKHLAGAWEFPGGKREPGESPEAALRRELAEEIGIDAGVVEPLIAVPWHYPEKSILLDVFEVRDWHGSAHGREGQSLHWSCIDEMPALSMPPADRPVIAALRLPAHYPVTPEPGDDDASFLRGFGQVLDNGETCIQLRCKSVSASRRRALAQAACALAREAGAQVLINGDAALADELGVGLHLPSSMLMQMTQRPFTSDRWFAASCHDARGLARAAAVGVDFAVLGPVLPTRSHPHATTLGWDRFAELVAPAPLPVFALGGLTPSDLSAAKNAGAQGIAGISGFWPYRR